MNQTPLLSDGTRCGLQVVDPDGNAGTVIASYEYRSPYNGIDPDSPEADPISMAVVEYAEIVGWTGSAWINWDQEDLEVAL